MIPIQRMYILKRKLGVSGKNSINLNKKNNAKEIIIKERQRRCWWRNEQEIMFFSALILKYKDQTST